MIESGAATTRDPNTALAAINALPPDAAGARFRDRACGCERWAEALVTGRPYASEAELLDRANRAFEELTERDWHEAFAAHSEIGAPRTGDARGSTEQSALAAADAAQLDALRAANARYRARFGHVFLIRARGRAAAELLAALEQRLSRTPEQELRAAAAAQREITELRLREWLAE